MTTATERLSVLVSKAQKAQLARKAKHANLSVSEYMRRAAKAYNPEYDELLDGLIAQLERSTYKASQAIDAALEFVAKSNERIKRL